MDNRRQAWVLFGVLAAMYCFSQFYRMSTAVIAVDLDREFGLGPVRLSVLGGAFFYAFASVQIPLGLALDRWGARRILIGATALGAAGCILFALSPGWYGLLAGRVLMGLGMAPVLMGSFKLFARWFPAAAFGRVSGLMLAVGTLGSLLAATPLAELVGRVGWRASFLGFGVATLAITGVLAVVVRDRPEGDPGGGQRGSSLGGLFRLARMPGFWAMVPLALTGYAAVASVQGLWGGPFFMENLGYSRVETGNILFQLGLFTALGSAAGGLLSDRWIPSRKWVVVGGNAVGLVFLLPLLGVARPPTPAGWGVALGAFAFFSAFRSLLYAHVKELVPEGYEGTAVTAVNFFVMLGPALLQQAIGGVLAWRPGAYEAAFGVLVAGLGLGTLAYLGTPDTHPSRQGSGGQGA
ncbi:MFS transporter [Deferrisoma palaeochoriense]